MGFDGVCMSIGLSLNSTGNQNVPVYLSMNTLDVSTLTIQLDCVVIAHLQHSVASADGIQTVCDSNHHQSAAHIDLRVDARLMDRNRHPTDTLIMGTMECVCFTFSKHTDDDCKPQN